MTLLRRFCACILLLVAIPNLPVIASPAHAAEANVTAALLVQSNRVAPGQSTKIALKLTPKPGWHVYWSNPGDSGMPPRINWTLPTGVSISDLRHPAPHVMDAAGYVSYVHEGEVALLADLDVDKRIEIGSALQLQANVQWLACSDSMCVPERTKLVLELAAGTGLGPSPSGTDFTAFEKAMPRSLTAPGQIRAIGDKLEFTFPNSVIDASSARLFPSDPSFDASAVQSARRDGNNLIFTVASSKGLPKKFAGVITAKGAPRGFSVVARPVQTDVPAKPEVDGKPSETSLPVADHSVAAIDKPNISDLQQSGSPVERLQTTEPSKPTSIAPAHSTNASSAIGFWAALFGAVLGGLILNLMPCVFPILSLKALTLARSGCSEQSARSEAISYTAGAVLVCALLGAFLVALRATGSEIGWAFQLQNPYVILSLIFLISAIALNLMGAFELPSLSFGYKLSAKEGPSGAFWTGALAAFIATPCSGPFMGLAIGAALVLSPVAAIGIFIGLGFGLALPFLLIGTIPQIRSYLPKPGTWMVRVRQLLAIPMFLTAAALIWILGRQTGPNGLTIGLVAFLSAFIALCWIGQNQKRGAPALVPIIFLVTAIATLGARLPAPDMTSNFTVSELKREFSEDALAELRAKDVPVFVDFTADWCLTCKVNERIAINTDATQAALKEAGVVTLVGDWTNNDPKITRFLAKHGRNSIPFYLYYAPNKEPIVLPQILGPSYLAETVQSDG